MKHILKESFIITVPSNKPTTGAPVGPMIGQRGLSSNELSKEVIDITKIYHDDVPCRIEICVSKEKKMSIESLGIPLSYYLKSILEINQSKTLSYKQLYTLARYLTIKKYDYYDESVLRSMYKQVLSYIKSVTDNKIIIE